MLNNQINMSFVKGIVVEMSKGFLINSAIYASHVFKFQYVVKKSKETGFEKRAKKAFLNNLKGLAT